MKFSEMYPAVGLRANRKEKRKKVPRLSMKKDYHRLQKKGGKMFPLNFRKKRFDKQAKEI